MPQRVARHEVTQPRYESYRYIPLTQDQTAIVDAEDLMLVSEFRWCAQRDSRSGNYYAVAYHRGRVFYMHRLVLGLRKKTRTTVVDHKDRNPLNNRKSNLRICTQSDNRANCKRWDRKNGEFKGVYFVPAQWRVRICRNGKRLSLGSFQSAEEAAHAYDKKAKELFGEFANLNFPEAHQ